MQKKVGVYCASSDKIDDHYFEVTTQIAQVLTQHQYTVVYGGGGKGLMGRLADTVIAQKGHIIGIIPEFMKAVEWEHKGVSELVVVEDMAERKKRLMEVDALIALPGGSGTFEELLEAITLKRLGKFVHPIIILNHRGYYDPLVELFERSIQEKFMREEHRNIWTVIHHPEELIEAIENAPDWDEKAIHFAVV
ncbi:MAG: TIGR00730 family Rossman fold protein [Bacteroidota bacterium]